MDIHKTITFVCPHVIVYDTNDVRGIIYSKHARYLGVNEHSTHLVM